jgi:hypothetical protein
MITGFSRKVDSQIVKKLPEFMEHEGSLPFSEGFAICLLPDSVESSPHLHKFI